MRSFCGFCGDEDEDCGRRPSDPLMLDRSRRPVVLCGMLVARERLLDSWSGESGTSGFVFAMRSVCGVLGSMFSFRLGVLGRGGGDILLIGEPKRAGELLFMGDELLAGDARK